MGRQKKQANANAAAAPAKSKKTDVISRAVATVPPTEAPPGKYGSDWKEVSFSGLHFVRGNELTPNKPLCAQLFLERLHNTRMFGSMIEDEDMQEEFDGLIRNLEEMASGSMPEQIAL